MNFGTSAYQLAATLCLLVAMLLAPPVRAQLAVPALTGHVTDQTGTLTAAQIATLEQSLIAFEVRKGSQLAVLVVPTTVPETIDQYALRVAEQWKLGRKKVDDGAVLVVAKNDRAVRLEVGYGLEGALTDITSQRIISDTILPRFRQQDYYGGIEAGLAQIVRVVEGEPLAQPQRSGTSTSTSPGFRQFVPFLFLVALGIGGAMRSAWGRVASALATGVVVSVLAWFVIGTVVMAALAGVAALLVTLLGIGRFPLAAGGGAGYGGGGFGGSGGFQGGGGGFGGGGASGRW